MFEALSGCHDVLILGKSHLKEMQRPNMVIAVDLDVKHQFKQTLTPRISYIGTHTLCRKRSFSLANVNIHTMLLYSTRDSKDFDISPLDLYRTMYLSYAGFCHRQYILSFCLALMRLHCRTYLLDIMARKQYDTMILK